MRVNWALLRFARFAQSSTFIHTISFILSMLITSLTSCCDFELPPEKLGAELPELYWARSPSIVSSSPPHTVSRSELSK